MRKDKNLATRTMRTRVQNLVFTTIITLLTAAIAYPQAAQPKKEKAMDSGNVALVIIDIQNFYFAGGRVPLVAPIEASMQAKRLLQHFRSKSKPVIHVQHLAKNQTAASPDSGDEQYRIHPNVMPNKDEKIIGKHFANAFRDTELLAIIKQLGATRLIICGMQTHMCVEAATRAAADLGFEVVVVHDACATRDLKFNGVETPAAEVHAAALAAMNGNYARVISADELFAEMR